MILKKIKSHHDSMIFLENQIKSNQLINTPNHRPLLLTQPRLKKKKPCLKNGIKECPVPQLGTHLQKREVGSW